MKNVKAISEKGTPLQRFEENQSWGDSILLQAIENADGVPFQLIFGPQIGEGYYPGIGNGTRKLFGIEPGDFTEKLFYSMIEEVIPLVDDIPADASEARRRFICGDIPAWKVEVQVMTPGGERKWIRDTSLPLTDNETGKIVGSFGILTELSDHKNSQLAVIQAGKVAAEYDRLKTAFLQNISHEIRTPLNAIVGFSTLLCEEPQSALQQQEFKDIIIRSTDHLLRVISDIVEMSKLEAGIVTVRKESVDIRALLERLQKRFSAKTAEKGIGLRFTFKSAVNGEIIEADNHKVTHLLEALLENAIKFTRKGRIEFGCKIKEGEAEFYVSDTGTGITGEHREEIFKRFYQAETSPSRSYGGIGLGLTIAREYIGLMGGKIWFTTKEGEGTQFRFTVPYKI
jgi:signal transduction histidine kinase